MIIAELSANHGQHFETAKQLIFAAHEAGADAVKVQTYTPDTITFRSNQPPFVIEDQALWKGQSLWDLYQKAYTPWEWQPELKQIAEEKQMKFIASVFDFSSVDFWEEHRLEIYKIASAELIDIPLLKKVAATGKPMIVSTGMATMEEIDEAVECIRSINPDVDLTLLKCSSAYPAPVDSMHLKVIQTLISRYGVQSGLSDHTLSNTAALTSIGLGGTVFEKHLKLPQTQPTPDDAFSILPDQFKCWATEIRSATAAMGSATPAPSEAEIGTLPFRKSLFVVKNIRKGEAFTANNIAIIRPASGMHPRNYESVLGKTATADIPAGTPLSEALVI